MINNAYHLAAQVNNLFFWERERCLHEADVVSWVYVSISDLIVCQINHTQ